MKRIIVLLLPVLLFSALLNGQNKAQYFKTVPSLDANTPTWAKLMYSDDPDVRKVELAYRNFYESNDYIKTIHTQNYKYWWRIISENIDENGKIRMPSAKEQREILDFIKAKKQNRSGGNNASKTPGTWTSLGPIETYTDGSASMPVSWQANLYSIDQSKSNPNILFAGSEAGGVFKTTDKGLNWTLASKDETFVSGIYAVKIHPTDPNIVYIGANNRIYKTTDGGTTWTELFNLGFDPHRLYIHQSEPDTVFCAGVGGFYRSYDAGVTWTGVFNDQCYDIESHPTNPDTLYVMKADDAEVRSELFRSLDGGVTWAEQTTGFYTPDVPAEAISRGARIGVTPANPDLIYVALIGQAKNGDNGWIGVYKSTDSGANWANTEPYNGGPYTQTTHPNLATQDWRGTSFNQGFYNFGFAVSHTNADRFWVGNLSLWETNDGGDTYAPLGGYASNSRLSNMHPDIQDIHVLGTDVWVTTDGGVNYSDDELQTHASRKKGIIGSDYWGFGSGWNEDVLVGGRYHNGNGGYYQTYGIGNHLRLGGGEAPTGYVDPLKERTGYFSDISTTKIPTSLTGDLVRSPKLSDYPNTHYWESYSSELEFDPIYAGHFYMGKDSSFWKSTDGGASYTVLGNFPNGSRVEEIEISRDNPQVVYAAVKNSPGGYWDWSTIYRSDDGGVTWTQKTTLPASHRRGFNLSQNPNDEDELWVSIVSAGNGQKVYQTTDGGTTWINKTTAALDGESVKDILYVGGATASAYVVTNYSIYYYDENTSDWVSYDTDMPFQTRALQMRPFYRDEKLRLATGGRGIWETDLFEMPAAPSAQPMTYQDTVRCERDTVKLDCYSILAHSGASWQWTVTPAPAFISSTTARNPKMVMGADGNYTVTLTVTDGNANSNSKTVNDMIIVQSNCEADTLAGNALQSAADGDYFVSQEVGLEAVTNFSMTAWIKPDGVQGGFAGIVSNGVWCAHCVDGTAGFVFDYYGNKLWYRWNGNADNWASNSNLVVPQNEWSYVALVVYPDSAIMYLNEDRYVHVKSLSPTDIQNLYVGHGHYSHSFKGEIDEVTVVNRSMTRNEIRELRHLTKENFVINEPDLVAYYQFNEFEGNHIMDVGGTNHGTLSGGATIGNSTAPVGSGTSNRLAFLGSSAEYNFAGAGAKLFFNDCDPPSGEMVVSRLNNPPHNLPSNAVIPDNYWLVNYYGNSGNDFAFLDSVELTPSDPNFIFGLGNIADAKLQLRGRNDDDETWTPTASAKNESSGILAFDRAVSIDSSMQILLTNGSTAFAENVPEDYCEPDDFAGKALQTFGNGDYVQTPVFGVTTDALTMSAWVKPDGIQNEYSGIVMSDGTSAGMNFRESNNTLAYHWNGGWSWDSGLELPADEWSHVAMVVEPNSVTLYLNGVGATHTRSTGTIYIPTVKIASYQGWFNRNFIGEMDEVVVWNRSLSQDEIRDLMHLTKDEEIPTDPTILAYYQFNEDASTVYDKSVNSLHANFTGTSTLIPSTAPVGGGTSQRMTVNSGGNKNFTNTKLLLDFPDTGTYPDGELVVYRIENTPDTLPSEQIVPEMYWIVRNYGANQTFSELDKIIFNGIDDLLPGQEDSTQLFNMYKRASNEHLNNWTLEDEADSAISGTGGRILFNSGNGITSFSQFAIADGRGISLSAKAFLSGAYSGTEMTDSLRVKGLIPLVEPYSNLGFVHVNGGGGETCENSVFATSGSDAIVDWVFLELRDSDDSTVVVFTRSALIQRDGDIVDTDGVSVVNFPMALKGDYFVAVKHRNHLGIMSSSAISFSATAAVIDFSATAALGANSQTDTGGGILGMWSGDVNQSGVVDAADRHLVWNARPNIGYRVDDVNLDGVTDNGDNDEVWKDRNAVENK